MLYLYIALGVAVAAYAGLLSFRIVRNKKRKKAEQEKQEKLVKENLNEVDDVRYTMEENAVKETEEGTPEVNATFLQKDFVLPQNTPFEVSSQGELKPGKYIVLSTDENQTSFNIRVGIYVREYKHNQEIILAEGDTICAVSGAVILR